VAEEEEEEEEEGVTGCASSYAATNPWVEGYGPGMTKQTAYEPHTFRRLKSTLRVLFDGLGMTYG
jgi:hypothetical protein